jgi:hypothetical protein
MQKVHRVRIPDDKVYSGIAGHNDIAVTTPRGCFKLRAERVPGSPGVADDGAGSDYQIQRLR